MTLFELTEPLFQYVCRLNRLARKSGIQPTGETIFFTHSAPKRAASLDYAVVRSDVKTILDTMRQKAEKDFRLAAQLQKVELPLIFFVDSLIAESALGFAAEWNKDRLAYERHELAGDEKFFNLLDADLKDTSEEASERLAVYYGCIGLGFAGVYLKQPEMIRKTMLSIAPRIRRWLDEDDAARICPDAYESVDTRDLTTPPSRRVMAVSLIFVCLTVAALVSYAWLCHRNTKELNDSFYRIEQNGMK
jgi:type VI secretion system protein ImpK